MRLRFLLGGAIAGAATLTACQLLLDLGDANGVPPDDGGAGGVDGAGSTDTSVVIPVVHALPLSRLLDPDVTPEAVVLGDHLYVAGRRGTRGWVGSFDPATLALLGSVDIDVPGDDGTTALLAIATADGGLVVAGQIEHDVSSEAVVGAVASDFDASLHVVTPLEPGAASLSRVGSAIGLTWASGSVKLADGGVHGWFAAGDTACDLPQSAANSEPIISIDLAIEGDVVAVMNGDNHAVSYFHYTDASCDPSGFESPGQAQGDIQSVVADEPYIWTTASSGNYFYFAGSDLGTGTFFVAYKRTTGQRPPVEKNARGVGGVDTFPGVPSSFVAAAHDGNALFAVGTVGAAETVVVVGAQFDITQGDASFLPISSYSARGLAVAQGSDQAFYLVGGAPARGYVLRCDKTLGCPSLPDGGQ